MGLKSFMNSPRSKMIIALLLGFGLSTFFRKECKDQSCIDFKAPALDKINDQAFKYNTKCYEFQSMSTKCDGSKKTVSFE